eukprot:scaffold27419_cov126-Skeletonema_marinoi.AAC.3
MDKLKTKLGLWCTVNYLQSILKRGRAYRLGRYVDSAVGPCLFGSSTHYYLMCRTKKQPHVLHRTQIRIFHRDQVEYRIVNVEDKAGQIQLRCIRDSGLRPTQILLLQNE